MSHAILFHFLGAEACNMDTNPTTLKLQHTSNQEKYDQCGNSME